MTSPLVRGSASLTVVASAVGASLVVGLPEPTRVLLILAAATTTTAYLVTELARWYLNYLLGKEAIARCDPDRVPDTVAAVTGHVPPPRQ